MTANVDAGCQPGAGDVDMNRTPLQRLKEQERRQYAGSIGQYDAVRAERREAKADRRKEGRVAEPLEEGEEEEDEKGNPWHDAGDDDAGCQPGAAGDEAEVRARLKKVREALNDLESTSERKDLETEMPTTMDELNVDVQRLKAEMKRDPHRIWREAREKGGAGDAGCQPELARKTKNDSAAGPTKAAAQPPIDDVDVVEMLDRAGLAHVRDRSKDWTALHHAVEECKRQKTSAPNLVAVVAKVLAADPTLIGARTQGLRPPQNTALHLASKGRYHEAEKVVGMLLEARADPAAVDNRQCTPIMMAASTANEGAFEVLLEALDDATAKARNVDGRDAPPID